MDWRPDCNFLKQNLKSLNVLFFEVFLIEGCDTVTVTPTPAVFNYSSVVTPGDLTERGSRQIGK